MVSTKQRNSDNPKKESNYRKQQIKISFLKLKLLHFRNYYFQQW